ncbi:MAG: ribose 5-phosphate isomerase B [Deltaproteobacteria bacterium]|nr:ribose 5-phosphate isomerase B [Deltaproteobacteria bacterium]
MKIVIGSDHAGFALKEDLKKVLIQKGHQLTDVGCVSEDRCDYPDSAAGVAKKLVQGEAERGVLICGSGIGVCMTANRFAKVRAAVLRIEEDAKLSRQHNDANVACFGARLTNKKEAEKLLEIFLITEFEGGRHVGRINKIDEVSVIPAKAGIQKGSS